MNPPPQPPVPRPDYQLVGPVEDDAAPHTPPFRIQRLVPFFLKFWWLPILTLALGLGAAAAYAWLQPPTYVSTGRMWESVKLRLPEGSLFTEDVQNVLGTQTELLQSATLRELTLARLASSGKSSAVAVDKNGHPLPVSVRVSGGSKSSIFMIEATGSRAGYTRSYLDALMNVYIDYKKDIRKVVSGDTLASISEQVRHAEQDLKAEQDILNTFQRTNNLAILEEVGRTEGGYLARLRTQLSDLLLEYRLLSATASNPAPVLSGSGETFSTNDLGSISAAGSASGHQSAFQELALLRVQRQKLSKYLRPKHPKIVKLDADIERAGELLEIYKRQDQGQLAASRAAIQMKIDNVELSIKQWESNVVVANARLADGERLKINVSRSQSVYERWSMLLQNVGMSRNIEQEGLQVFESASPARRSFKQETNVMGMASVCSFGLGLAVICLLAFRDDRFTSLDEINEKIGEVVVGQVPEVSGLESATPITLLELGDERHAYAESFRNLRSALMFMTLESERPRVVLITSALPHEGKSTVAANLARTLALGGSSVVLVDADMRKGSLHRLMGMVRQPGLAELLGQTDSLEKVLQTNCQPNLAFIASGQFSRNAGDLFLGKAFDLLLVQLRQRFDYVLIDSSPVFAADDATTLAPKIDGTLFVVRSRFSRPGPVREALQLLYQRNAKVLGVIFNQADPSARSYYYYKYAEYHPSAEGA